MLRAAGVAGGVGAVAVVLAVMLRPAGGSTGPVWLDGAYNGGGTPSAPGRLTDFPVPAVNHGSRPAVLESVSLVPVPGLEQLVVERAGVGLPNQPQMMAYDWPPRHGTDVNRVVPLEGYVVRPNASPAPILYVGTVGRHVGDAAFAGVVLHYRVGAHQYRSVLWEAGQACLYPPGVEKGCSGNKVFDAAAKVKAHSTAK